MVKIRFVDYVAFDDDHHPKSLPKRAIPSFEATTVKIRIEVSTQCVEHQKSYHRTRKE